MLDVVDAARVDDHHLAVLVASEPRFVERLEGGQVGARDLLLERSAALLDAADERLQRAPQVDHQVRRADLFPQRRVEILVHGPVAIVDVTALVEMRGEDLGVFVDRPVLDDVFLLGSSALVDVLVDLEATNEKEHLALECPAPHVAIEVREVGVLLVRLEERHHVELLLEPMDERRLARAHVAGDGDDARPLRAAHSVSERPSDCR